jgi:uncharacterized protein
VARNARDFQIFAKPAGAACNLNCRYCYYLKADRIYPDGASFRMSEEILERYVREHIETAAGEEIRFSWHGGEPMLLGLDFFRKALELQNKYRPAGARIINGIQTNGMFLDEEWCRFIAAERFAIGLSMDGPREMHDRYRHTKAGEPTFRQVMNAFKLMKRHRIPFDILCTVNDYNVQFPIRVYRFFKEIGASYIGFLPVVERCPESANGVTSQSVPAQAYGDFLCAIFDEWVRQDIGRIRIQIFEEAARPVQGLDHSLCIFRETCGDVPVIEHNGDFFTCDHFVDEDHRMGNIRDVSLSELLDGPGQRAFGAAKRDRLPKPCLSCDVRPMCNGGCLKDRFLRTPDGEEGLNYLCSGLKKFFRHSLPYLTRISAMERMGSPAQEPATEMAQATLARSYPAAGRNDACPCGSGKKYKKCCLP